MKVLKPSLRRSPGLKTPVTAVFVTCGWSFDSLEQASLSGVQRSATLALDGPFVSLHL